MILLEDAQECSTLGSCSGYRQNKIDRLNIEKRKLTCRRSLYKFQTCLYGLKNVVATVQRLLDVLLSTVRLQYALVFLNNKIVFYKTLEDSTEHKESVLFLGKDAGNTLKAKRLAFFTNWIDYIGNTIMLWRLEVANSTAETIWKLQVPMTVTKPKSFLRWRNVSRIFLFRLTRTRSLLSKRLPMIQARKRETDTKRRIESTRKI